MRAVQFMSMIITSIFVGLTIAATGFALEEDRRQENCLALNIYHEARGEPIMGQIAVAHVTLNRVADKRWPNNICDVVYQRKQFSWTHMVKNHKPKKGDHWNIAKSIAKDVIDGVDEDNTDGAVYYHADYVNPVWNRKLTITTKIGAHIFYKD